MGAYTRAYWKQWTAENAEHRRTWDRTYSERKRHKCATRTCTTMVHYQHKYCRSCAAKRRHARARYQRAYYLARKHPCAECSELCAPGHERCVTCENQRRARNRATQS